MKKTILSLLLVTLSCLAFAKQEVKSTFVLKSENTVLKQQLKHALRKSKSNNKTIQKLLHNYVLSCSLQGQAWADTFEIECPDGGTSAYVVSGIVWELFCPLDGIYMAFCTDVSSSLSYSDC
jgi:CTP:phosphocholine cytidylyltransferase-like protein